MNFRLKNRIQPVLRRCLIVENAELTKKICIMYRYLILCFKLPTFINLCCSLEIRIFFQDKKVNDFLKWRYV